MRLARRLAAQEWSTSLGESTSCDLSRNGHGQPLAKFSEGRVAALSELLRSLADNAPPAAVADEAARVQARWVGKVAAGSRGDAYWHAYRAGGAQAMAEVLTAYRCI